MATTPCAPPEVERAAALGGDPADPVLRVMGALTSLLQTPSPSPSSASSSSSSADSPFPSDMKAGSPFCGPLFSPSMPPLQTLSPAAAKSGLPAARTDTSTAVNSPSDLYRIVSAVQAETTAIEAALAKLNKESELLVAQITQRERKAATTSERLQQLGKTLSHVRLEAAIRRAVVDGLRELADRKERQLLAMSEECSAALIGCDGADGGRQKREDGMTAAAGGQREEESDIQAHNPDNGAEPRPLSSASLLSSPTPAACVGSSSTSPLPRCVAKRSPSGTEAAPPPVPAPPAADSLTAQREPAPSRHTQRSPPRQRQRRQEEGGEPHDPPTDKPACPAVAAATPSSLADGVPSVDEGHAEGEQEGSTAVTLPCSKPTRVTFATSSSLESVVPVSGVNPNKRTPLWVVTKQHRSDEAPVEQQRPQPWLGSSPAVRVRSNSRTQFTWQLPRDDAPGQRAGVERKDR